MASTWVDRLARFLSRNRRNPWVRRAANTLLKLHRGYENLNYDLESNGELFTLSTLARAGAVHTVFDVGANRGDWCEIALRTFPAANVHAFEIVPQTFTHLQQRFGGNARLVLNNLGLSDTEGTLDVYFSPEHDFIATCVPGFSEPFHHYNPAQQAVSATTGDRYCAAKGIEAIDFLKIDVEGFEPQVLRGFEGMLRRGRIGAVQFEYGYINAHTHFLLKDFYDYFAQADMVVGKIYPNYVDFRPYRYLHEDFYGPNYLAVRADRQDLLKAFGAS